MISEGRHAFINCSQSEVCASHSSWAEKMDLLTSKSSSDPEGYLAHPVNAYKLVKRLNTDWLELENLVLQDTTNGKELQGRRHQEVVLQPLVLFVFWKVANSAVV